MKIPVSILAVIVSPERSVLLLERADHPGFWQSVTGSLNAWDEDPVKACVREVEEETGFRTRDYELIDLAYQNRYPIFPQWRHRYAEGVVENLEHVFALCLKAQLTPRLAEREHIDYDWLPWWQAADRCFSWTNSQAIHMLARSFAWTRDEAI